MPQVGFETTISECERPQTYASDRAATGTGLTKVAVKENSSLCCIEHHAMTISGRMGVLFHVLLTLKVDGYGYVFFIYKYRM